MFNRGYRMLGAGARGWSREMIWGGRWERGSGLGTHVHLWLIHVNVWQNQYSTVKQNKVKIKKKTHTKIEHFESYSLHLEKCSSTAWPLAYRGWQWVNRQEELLPGGGKGCGRWKNWRVISNRRQRASCNFHLMLMAQVLVPRGIQFYLLSGEKNGPATSG